MSEKELKIAELATVWGVSVPATWNRVRKEGLKTVKKIDENRKEVTYVVISEETVNKYLSTVNNNINNRYYEELLTNNNINNDNNNGLKTESEPFSASEMFDKLTALNKEYNNRLEQVNEELIMAKSKMLLLEDKAGREGLYINEINGLKTDNNKLKRLIYCLFAVIVILLLGFTCYLTYNIVVAKTATTQPTTEKTSAVQTQKTEVKPIAQPRDKRIKK